CLNRPRHRCLVLPAMPSQAPTVQQPSFLLLGAVHYATDLERPSFRAASHESKLSPRTSHTPSSGARSRKQISGHRRLRSMRKRVFAPLLVCCLIGVAAAQQRPSPATKSLLPVIATAQYDNARTGANLVETLLTPQNVNAVQFGRT